VVEESYACADVGRGVGLCAGLEQGVAGFDGEEDDGVHGKGIHHIEIAAVQAAFADARGNAYLRILFGEFGTGEKEISRRPALFLIHDRAREALGCVLHPYVPSHCIIRESIGTEEELAPER
jgi:hypothetical protein